MVKLANIKERSHSWSSAEVLKTSREATPSRVRISPSPPSSAVAAKRRRISQLRTSADKSAYLLKLTPADTVRFSVSVECWVFAEARG